MNTILIIYALTILLFGFDSNSGHDSTRGPALRASRTGWRTIADGVGLGKVSFEPWFRKRHQITMKLRSIFDPSNSRLEADECPLNLRVLVEKESPH